MVFILGWLFQVQRQLQLRIEAQGKYLQKIIEEQQKLGGTLNDPETSAADEKDKSLQTPQDALVEPLSPLKKQKMDDCVLDTTTPRGLLPADEKPDYIISQWDRDLYGRDVVGFGYDVVTGFKEGGDGGREQTPPAAVGSTYGSRGISP